MKLQNFRKKMKKKKGIIFRIMKFTFGKKPQEFFEIGQF